MEIKILGTGCPRCKRLESVTREIAAELGIDATFTKVTDLNDIMAYPVTHTPALVIDEQVKCSGHLPTREQIRAWLAAATRSPD